MVKSGWTREVDAASELPDILSSRTSFARPSHTSSLRKQEALGGQYLPDSPLVCNCPSASPNECQSYFSAAGFLTAVRVIIMESDGRYQGSFPWEEDNHNILPVRFQSVSLSWKVWFLKKIIIVGDSYMVISFVLISLKYLSLKTAVRWLLLQRRKYWTPNSDSSLPTLNETHLRAVLHFY